MGDWEGVEGGGEAVAVRMGGDSWILKLLPASPRGWILALRRQGPARRERYMTRAGGKTEESWLKGKTTDQEGNQFPFGSIPPSLHLL